MNIENPQVERQSWMTTAQYRHAQRRAHAKHEANLRAGLRPLRNQVNKALKHLTKSNTHSTRIRGWTKTTFGWETESDIYENLVRVHLMFGDWDYAHKGAPKLRDDITEALTKAGIQFTRHNNNRWLIKPQ